MRKLKLNAEAGQLIPTGGYNLDAKEKYVINAACELDAQFAIFCATHDHTLVALSDYHDWLTGNGFNAESPNPTNAFVRTFYGEKPLWETELSLGIVVRAEDSDDYYIVMECSGLNKGFCHTQILLTPKGCL